MKNSLDVKKILDRVKDAAGVKTDLELCKVLNIKQSALSMSRQRGTINLQSIINFCDSRKISLDWIIKGEDPQAEHLDDLTGKILEMLKGMDEEQRRDILRYTQKTELLEYLLKERRA